MKTVRYWTQFENTKWTLFMILFAYTLLIIERNVFALGALSGILTITYAVEKLIGYENITKTRIKIPARRG